MLVGTAMSRISFWAPLVAASALIGAVNHFGPKPTTGAEPCFATVGQNVDKTSPTYQKYLALYTKLLQKSPGLRGEGASVCFHPNTPEAQVRAFQDAMARFPGNGRWPAMADSPWQAYQASSNKWPSKSLTWSFIPDGTMTDADTSNLFAKMDEKFANDRAKWISKFVAYLTRWSSLGGFSYARKSVSGQEWDDGVQYSNGSGGAGNGVRGDMRIGGHDIDGENGILAYNYFPTYGEMVVDMSEKWEDPTNDFRSLRNTLGHEHGHGIGIAHVCPANGKKLMEPYLNTSFDGPQEDDVRACHGMYGDKNEPNNVTAQATNLGAILAGGPAVTFGDEDATRPANVSSLSITSPSDIDFYRLSVDKPTQVQVKVIPLGSVYQDGPQTGACDAGTLLDAKAAQNLAITMYAADGVTVLGTQNATLAGNSETLKVPVAAIGTFFVKIWSASGGKAQMYTMEVVADRAGPVISKADPSTIGQNTGPRTVNLTGISFKTPLTAKWTSPSGVPTNISLTVASETAASVILPNSLLGTLGTGTITLTNAEGASNAFPIKIATNVTLNSISPTSIKAGTSARLSLTGTGFEKNTIVSVGKLKLKVIYINSTKVQVFIPPSALTVLGSYSVTHTSTEGVTSNAKTLLVYGGLGF